MRIVATLSICFLCFSASTAAQVPTATNARSIATEIENSESRVSQIILRAEEHFRKGKHQLTINQLEKAREEFDMAVDCVLESGFDVRDNQRLQTFYFEMIERIYQEEVPLGKQIGNTGPKNIAGFRNQIFVANQNDELSKLLLTGKQSPKPPSIGPRPSQLANGQVPVVIRYLNDNLNDPYSMKLLKWSKLHIIYKYNMPFWYVSVRLRAKNGFGAYILKEAGFYLKNNKVIFTDNL